jgi:deoxyribonuclease-1
MLILLFSLALAQDETPSLADVTPDVVSFSTAKKRMYAIHTGQPTLYCGCEWQDKVVNLYSCELGGFDSTRWNRTEAEHVVPAYAIGAHRPCWAEGRDHCLKVDEDFKKAHNDLHNLRPAVGQINGYRSNNAMGIVAGDELEWGACDFEVDLEADIAEPREERRGDIARIYFYMEWQHGITIPAWQRPILLHWHQLDPVTDTERELDKSIELKQGNSNPFVR